MNSKEQDINAFQSFLYLLVEDTLFEKDKNLSVDLILNPHSGSFSQAGVRRRIVKELEKASGAFTDRVHEPRRTGTVHFRTHRTTAPGCETALVKAILEEDDVKPPARLILVAGGDGTARYVLEALLHQSPEIQNTTTVFRLPMGTGNDGADVPDWQTAAWVLSGQGRLEKIHSWRIEGGGLKETAYGFNISSVGLDAYIVELNALGRKILPGNFYTLMTNVAGLIYGPVVGHPRWEMVFYQEGKEVHRVEDDMFLGAFGVTGHRTYGAGKKVLPDVRNICLVRRAPVTKMLKFSSLLFAGEHEQLEWVTLLSADRVEIRSDGPLPANIDGEPFWVDRGAWPLTFTLQDPAVQVLKAPETQK